MTLTRPALPDELAHAATPVVGAADRVVAVGPVLAPLFPSAGLVRGTTVAVSGAAATSVAAALGSAASVAGSWVAMVGTADIGAGALDELGLVLERVVVVPQVAPASWATVVGAFVDAVDLVYVQAPPRLSASLARRLGARVRERGAVLVALSSSWPGPADLRVVVEEVAWHGLTGEGGGRLQARELVVAVGGRGQAARPRRQRLWLPGPEGRVAARAEEPAGGLDPGTEGRAEEPAMPSSLAVAG